YGSREPGSRCSPSRGSRATRARGWAPAAGLSDGARGTPGGGDPRHRGPEAPNARGGRAVGGPASAPVTPWETGTEVARGRGRPRWENTLNRVPELPNAQEGSSMVWAASASRTPWATGTVLVIGRMLQTGLVVWVTVDQV